VQAQKFTGQKNHDGVLPNKMLWLKLLADKNAKPTKLVADFYLDKAV
jgi:hypothetical protein